MNIHVFYHGSDCDGNAGGAIARKGLEKSDCLVYLHPFENGQPFPSEGSFPEAILPEDQIFFIDVVVSPYEGMEEVIDKYPNLVIIDHHKSLIDWLAEKYPARTFPGIQRLGRGACYLAWEYFFPREDRPRTIELLSDYDVWDQHDLQEWDEVIYPFQMGFKTVDISPITNWIFWDTLFLLSKENELDIIRQTIQQGRTIIRYQDTMNRSTMENNGFEADFEGLKALCCNTNVRNTHSFKSQWNPKIHDLMVAFEISKDGRYRISLYTTKDIDCSEVAARYGGGGHKQAAGFQADQMSLTDINPTRKKLKFHGC